MATCGNGVRNSLYIFTLILCQVHISSSKTMDEMIAEAATSMTMFETVHMDPEGGAMVMTELDILMTWKEFAMWRGSSDTSVVSGRKKRKAYRNTKSRWPDCVVTYEIDQSLKKAESIIKSAMAEWSKYTCLTFSETKSNTVNKILFKTGDGCYSRLGMVGGVQPIVLGDGCLIVGIVVHEIGHAIGWFHEHMRPDRDKYVMINYENIPPGWHDQFKKYSEDVIDTHKVPYDYKSIMHYGPGKGYITTKNPDYQDVIGQRVTLSFKDIKLANLMYNCAKQMGCSNHGDSCPGNGFVNYKDKTEGKCKCHCENDSDDERTKRCDEMPITEAPVIASTKEPVKPPVMCEDLREDCEDLKKEGECKNNYMNMMNICMKTCGFCGKGKMCMDHDKSCPLLSAGGFCKKEGFDVLLKELCKASCGYCKPPDPCEMQIQLGLKELPPSSSAITFSVAMSAMLPWLTMII